MSLKHGFTLAEILTAITVIGIIAAFLIPAMLMKTNDKEIVAQYLKMSATLSNAYSEAHVQNDISKLEGDEFRNTFESYLSKIDCDSYDVCLIDGSAFNYSDDNTYIIPM